MKIRTFFIKFTAFVGVITNKQALAKEIYKIVLPVGDNANRGSNQAKKQVDIIRDSVIRSVGDAMRAGSAKSRGVNLAFSLG